MIFISGMSRSGTTLCQGLVCNSPQTIPVTAECSYLRALLDAYAQTKLPGFWNHAKHYWNSFEEYKVFHAHILDAYMSQVRENHMTGLIVQKEPRLLRVWPELYDFYPEANYICMIRDPRDIVASQLNRVGSTDKLDQWWQEQTWGLWKSSLSKANTIYVRYENLVTRSQSELEKLGEKLRIEIPLGEWDVLREDDSASALDGQLPSPSSIGRWKNVLPADVSKGIEQHREFFKETTGHDWFYDGG